MGIMPQDAYYYFYSEHLALSYYDHPPAIAYLIWVFTMLFGKKIIVLKLTATIITLFTIFSFYYLSKGFLNTRQTLSAMVLFLSTLMVTILSLVASPDVPLMLFWTLSLRSLYLALFKERKTYWIWAGLLMGLAFDSKYTAIFLPAGMFLFLVLSQRRRKLLSSPWPYLCMAGWLIAIAPVLVWNWQHEFVSFRFQSTNRMDKISGLHISIMDFLGTIGHQAAILIPILFFTLVWGLWKITNQFGIKFSRIPESQLFLLCFFLPLFIGFTFLSFFYWVKLNWMMPAYITGILWISLYMNEKWVRIQLIASLVIHLALAMEIAFYPVIIKSDDTWVGWNELAEKVQELKKKYPKSFVFSADDYKTSAVLNFYFDEMVYSKNIIGEKALQFDYVSNDLNLLKGENALFIDSDKRLQKETQTIPPVVLYQYFDRVTSIRTIQVKKQGRLVRRFHVYLCANYHPGKVKFTN
ncbi:glycosyltransferase family 39 protein [Flavihumibacter rivuli]|uniref:glycosyltransferase family 39 protein n=1 Tax=Flavihumibacter rivuli TaxID=2838156 RepID=UPI001BDDDFF1|nr:glycosyltransferase family 39 protein [Flavihumibacter rivuli]ULQ58307.1 glycosyltransferase family 39 protein [Flavihumibacter rivuli]